MIQPAGFRGVFFGDAADGNGRDDALQRNRVSSEVGISNEWASLHQVHGSVVMAVDEAGTAGDADGLITTMRGLPLAVATADCVPVIIEGDRSVAVLHAGWRGVAAGVVGEGVAAMTALGDTPRRAAIGPSIGPCCFEVGDEVIAGIGGFAAETSWGTVSADLWSAISTQLDGLEVWKSSICTYEDPMYRSFRKDGTTKRQVAVAWLP